MPQLTFFEKISVLFDNVLAYPLFLGLFIVPIIAFFLNKKKLNKLVIAIYSLVLIFILGINFKNIPALLDNLVEYIIKIINFPTMGIILAVIIFEITIIIMTVIRNYRTPVKIINSISFIIIQIMFGITLTLINHNKLDFTKETNLYNSLDITVMMQLIMMTFALQLALILISKAIDKVTLSIENGKATSDNKLTIFKNNLLDTINNIPGSDVIKPSETLVEPINFEGVKTPAFRTIDRIKSSGITSQDEFTYKLTSPVVIDRAKSKAITSKTNENTLKDEFTSAEKIKHSQTMDALNVSNPNLKLAVNIKKEKPIENIEPAKETSVISKTEITPVQKVELGQIHKNDISDIAARIDSIDVSSNKFITEETKRQMEAELRLYKEKLLKYKEEQLEKKEILRKQMEDFSSVFNITKDDLK